MYSQVAHVEETFGKVGGEKCLPRVKLNIFRILFFRESDDCYLCVYLFLNLAMDSASLMDPLCVPSE